MTTPTLPQRLILAGYQTAFFSAGDLDFLNTRKWIGRLYFETVYGPEHGDFAGQPRTPLGAIRDDAIYHSVEAWLTRKTGPAFVFVSTMGSHVPYGNPDTGERGEEAAFRYADRAFSEFVSRLGQSGYFDRGGVLILTADHRAIGPILPAEIDRFGISSSARVPFLLIGKDLPIPPTFSQQNYQQIDLAPSIAYLTTPSACFSPRQSNLFGTPSRSRCRYQARGEKLKHVGAYCPNGDHIVELDGDNSRFVTPTPLDANEILSEIAWIRTNGEQGQ